MEAIRFKIWKNKVSENMVSIKQTTAVSQFKTFSHLGSLFGPKQSQYK